MIHDGWLASLQYTEKKDAGDDQLLLGRHVECADDSQRQCKSHDVQSDGKDLGRYQKGWIVDIDRSDSCPLSRNRSPRKHRRLDVSAFVPNAGLELRLTRTEAIIQAKVTPMRMFEALWNHGMMKMRRYRRMTDTLTMDIVNGQASVMMNIIYNSQFLFVSRAGRSDPTNSNFSFNGGGIFSWGTLKPLW